MFTVLLAPLQELDQTRADNLAGMTVVGLVAVLFLLWVWREVRRETRKYAPGQKPTADYVR